MKDPPEYSGKSMNQLHSYLQRCNNTFELQSTKFESDEVKICWVVQYLTEDVANWWDCKKTEINLATWT